MEISNNGDQQTTLKISHRVTRDDDDTVCFSQPGAKAPLQPIAHCSAAQHQRYSVHFCQGHLAPKIGSRSSQDPRFRLNSDASRENVWPRAVLNCETQPQRVLDCVRRNGTANRALPPSVSFRLVSDGVQRVRRRYLAPPTPLPHPVDSVASYNPAKHPPWLERSSVTSCERLRAASSYTSRTYPCSLLQARRAWILRSRSSLG